MKTYREFRGSGDLDDYREYMGDHWVDDELLDEGILRTGTAAGYAMKAKSSGDAAEKLFQQSMSTTRAMKNADEDEKLDRTLVAMNYLCQGLIQMRNQIGATTSMLMTIATFASRTDKEVHKLIKSSGRRR